MIKFIDLQNQNAQIKDELLARISELIENSIFIGGDLVKEFERNFANFCESRFCLGVGNGTDALEICLEALDLPQGAEVLVPANSFIATAEAVTRAGLKPKFVPFDEDTFLINSEIVSQHLSTETSAVIPVHLYGQAVDVSAIRDITAPLDIKIIEDCAQAHGAKYEKAALGTYSDAACYSFYPGKNLGTIGDAGAITTNNYKLYEVCKRISNHGRLKKFDHDIIGRNSRIDAIHALTLSLKLKKIEQWTIIRRRNAFRYVQNLQDLNEIKLPFIRDFKEHVFHHFVIRCENRDALQDFLFQNGVGTGIHYPDLIPNFQAYVGFDCNAIDNGDFLLSIPVAEHLDLVHIDRISKLIAEFYQN